MKPVDLTFRADCEIYARVFLAALQFNLLGYELVAEQISLPDGSTRLLPDVMVEVRTAGLLSVRECCWIASMIPECEVIARTLALRDEYTGQERQARALPVPKTVYLQACIDGLRAKLPLCKPVISAAIVAFASFAGSSTRRRLARCI
ncbi:MAG: hypothetical protein WBK19_05935 [Azonexus sp.]